MQEKYGIGTNTDEHSNVVELLPRDIIQSVVKTWTFSLHVTAAATLLRF